MLSSIRSQKKQQKHEAHSQKKFNPEEDLPWSDEESDWQPKFQQSSKIIGKKDESNSADNTSRDNTSRNTSRPSTPGTARLQQSNIIEPGKMRDHKRSYLSGDAKSLTQEERTNKKKELQAYYNCRIPLPYVPSHVVETIGLEGLYFLWDQFLSIEEVDESELIRAKYIENIIQNFGVHMQVSYHSLYCNFDTVDEDDFIEFKDVAKQLAANICAIPPKFAAPKIDLAVCCCATSACKIHHTTDNCSLARPIHKKLSTTNFNDIAKQDPEREGAFKSFPLFVVYQRHKQKYNGKVRVKHLRDIMDDALIKYNPKALPLEYLSLYKEFIIKSFDELTWIICRVCGIMLTVPDPYRIAEWLKITYPAPLLSFYQMKYIEVDTDSEGCLVASKVLELFKSLGCHVNLAQCAEWVETFGEQMQEEKYTEKYFRFNDFMGLLHKIEKRVIPPKCKDILTLIKESFKHIPVFKELLDLKSDPTCRVKVVSFGFGPGKPVTADFLVEGTPDTPYAGAFYPLKVTFLKGYPYRCPEVIFNCRIFAVNLLINTNGSSTLPHIKQVWDKTWSIKRLLDHVHEDIFAHPKYDNINPDLVRIAKLWSQDILEERRLEEEMKALEEEQERENQRRIEENTASLVASLRSAKEGSISTAASMSDGSKETGPPADDASRQESAAEEAEPVEEEPEPEKEPEPEREIIEWFDRDELLEQYPRVAQMHVNVVALFLTEKEKYRQTIIEYVNKYAILIPPEPEPEPEPEVEGGPTGPVIEYMDEDYFYDPNAPDPEEPAELYQGDYPQENADESADQQSLQSQENSQEYVRQEYAQDLSLEPSYGENYSQEEASVGSASNL